jgi:hypothetical protein
MFSKEFHWVVHKINVGVLKHFFRQKSAVVSSR